MDTTIRCRLLELPAELRIRIYEEVLAPTNVLCLTATRTKRYATTPVLGPSLLSTCQQIYHEAKDILIEQNQICISMDCHDTAWPVIAEKRLPQHALERLQNVVMILDAATPFRCTYEDIDWLALTALVSLKTLRIVIVREVAFAPYAPPGQNGFHLQYFDLLAEVYRRVPAATVITYGSRQGLPDGGMLKALIERRQKGAMATVRISELDSAEYAGLSEAVADVTAQGSMSGGVANVFADYRSDRVKMSSFRSQY